MSVMTRVAAPETVPDRHEPPVPFVVDVMNAAADPGLPAGPGLYVGCGTGRNFLPLIAAGLDLVGLDVSPAAVDRLGRRRPDLAADRLLCGDLGALPAGVVYPVVVGLQAFQYGTAGEAHGRITAALDLVAVEGLFCLRVGAAEAEGRDTASTTDGHVEHLFDVGELAGLIPDRFSVLLGVRRVTTRHSAAQRASAGAVAHLEGIWRRTR